MNKFVSSLLCVMLIFLLASCSANEAETSTFGDTQAYSVTSEEVFTMAPTEPATDSVTVTPTTESTTVSTTESTTVYTTEPVSESTEVQSTEESTDSEATGTVRLIISCDSILLNKDKLKKEKQDFIPADGIILDVIVPLRDGETAFDVLKKACAEKSCEKNCKYCSNGIALEYSFTPAFGSYYVEGIHQIYEFDCGQSSGWIYKVNGNFADYSSSEYVLSPGDEVAFVYTCDMGADVGNAY